MELQISYRICAEVPQESILQRKESSDREDTAAAMRVERGKNHRGGSVPQPYPLVCRDTAENLGSLVYKGRKVALYGGAYAPSYLPNDIDTFACGVNCGNHQIHHPPLIVKVHFFPCVQIAGNFFDLFRADGIHAQLRYLFDKLLLVSVQFFNLAVHIGKQDGIGTGQCVLCGKKPK